MAMYCSTDLLPLHQYEDVLGVSVKNGGQEELFDYGVLFVHGIGSQKRGETLVQCAEVLIQGVHKRLSDMPNPPSQAPIVEEAMLTGGGSPAHAHVKIEYFSADSRSMENSRWLMAESRWADKFVTPTYGDIASWVGKTLPWTIISHVDRGFRRLGYRFVQASIGEVSPRIWLELVFDALGKAVFVFAGLLLVPALLLLLGLILVIAVVPNATIRRWLASVQLVVTSLIGDSFVFTDQKLGRGAIVSSVHRDLTWLSSRCKKIAIVAHSQGGAVAHAVVKDALLRDEDLFITLGSGLRKLAEINRIKGFGQRSQANAAIWRAIGFVVISALSVVWFTTFAPLEWPGYGLTEAALSVSASLCLGVTILAWQFTTFYREKERVSAFRAEAHPSAGSGFSLSAYLLLSALMPLAFIQLPWVQSPIAHAVAHWVLAAGLAFSFTNLLSWRNLAGLSAMPSRQASIDRELYEKDFELSTCMDWLDFPAASDPVSNGPLLDSYRPKRLVSNTVHNYNSVVRDHTSYWANMDGFVLPIAEHMIRAALRFVGPPNRYEYAFSEQRRARVCWLASTRRVLATLCVASFFVAVLLPSSWIDRIAGFTTVPAGSSECDGKSTLSKFKTGYDSGKFSGILDCFGRGKTQPESLGLAAFTSLLLFGLLYGIVLLPWIAWNARDGEGGEPGRSGGRAFWCFILVFVASLMGAFLVLVASVPIAILLTTIVTVGLLYWRMPEMFATTQSFESHIHSLTKKKNLTAIQSLRVGRYFVGKDQNRAIASFRSAMTKAAYSKDDLVFRWAAKAFADHSPAASLDHELALSLARVGEDEPIKSLAQLYCEGGDLTKAARLYGCAIQQGSSHLNLELGRLMESVSPQKAIDAYEAGLKAKHVSCADPLARLHALEFKRTQDEVHIEGEIAARIVGLRLGQTRHVSNLVYTLKRAGRVDEALAAAYQGASLGVPYCHLLAGEIELESIGDVENAKRAFSLELTQHGDLSGGRAHERLGFVSEQLGNYVAAKYHYSRGLVAGNELAMLALGELLASKKADLDLKWKVHAIDAYGTAVELGSTSAIAPLYSLLVQAHELEQALKLLEKHEIVEPKTTRALAQRLRSSNKTLSKKLIERAFLEGDIESIDDLSLTFELPESIKQLIREFAMRHPRQIESLARHFESVALLPYKRFAMSLQITTDTDL